MCKMLKSPKTIILQVQKTPFPLSVLTKYNYKLNDILSFPFCAVNRNEVSKCLNSITSKTFGSDLLHRYD